MATVGQFYPGLFDMHSASPEGQTLELIKPFNPIMEDALFTECNQGTKHLHSVLDGYPDATWGRLHRGVKASKASWQHAEDTTGWIESRSQIEERILELAKDPARQRLTSSVPFLKTLGLKAQSAFFYGNTDTQVEQIKGILPRMSNFATGIPDPLKPHLANQVINGGGVGSDNASIVVVTWSDTGVQMLYPAGVKAGIKIKDRGSEAVDDGFGGTYYAKVTTFEQHLGVAVSDYTSSGAVRNIDVSDLMAGTVDIFKLMRKLKYRLAQTYPMGSKHGRTAVYCNRTIAEAWEDQSSDRALINANPNYVPVKQAEFEGQMVKTWNGWPVRITDGLLNTEAAITGIAV